MWKGALLGSGRLRFPLDRHERGASFDLPVQSPRFCASDEGKLVRQDLYFDSAHDLPIRNDPALREVLGEANRIVGSIVYK